MTCDSQDRLIELNALFKEHDVIIAKLQQHLKEQLSQTMPAAELATALRFCQDRVTIFRHLMDTHFDFEKTCQQLYDTVHWRIAHNVDQLTWRSFPEWFEKGFAFYHKYDRWGQPILVVRLRHFPLDFIRQQQQLQGTKDGNNKSNAALDYLLHPYVCYMLEIARRLTFDETCRKERQQQHRHRHQHVYPDILDGESDGDGEAPMLLPLVVEVNMVIDMVDAPYIPIDAALIEALSHLVQLRFPFMVGNISVVNFRWLHQGLWKVLKRLLSDDTKDRISFVTKDHLLQSIPKENLLQELGGSDDYRWNIQFNEVLQKFDVLPQYDMLPPSPPSSTTVEPPEITPYHDTDDTTRANDGTMEKEPDLKVTKPINLVEVNTAKKSLGPFGVAMQRRQLGLRMGYPFLSSYLLDQLAALDNNSNIKASDKEYEANQVMLTSLVEGAHHGTAMEGSTQTATDAMASTMISGDANDSRQVTFFSLLGKSLCCLIFYILLRIPLESLIYRQLVAQVEPHNVLTSTIGITAGIAMMVGALIQVVDF